MGIAFVCNPRLVFLDEPSSGMDATARQECWDFLRSRREKTVGSKMKGPSAYPFKDLQKQSISSYSFLLHL